MESLGIGEDDGEDDPGSPKADDFDIERTLLNKEPAVGLMLANSLVGVVLDFSHSGDSKGKTAVRLGVLSLEFRMLSSSLEIWLWLLVVVEEE
jgi:hypothetical protein